MFYTVAEDRANREAVAQTPHRTFTGALVEADLTATPKNWVDLWDEDRFIGTYHVGMTDFSQHATEDEKVIERTFRAERKILSEIP